MGVIEQMRDNKRVRDDVLSISLGYDIEKAANKHDFSSKERKSLAKKGEAMPDGSYPIRNEQDLKDAIHAIGRAKDPEKTKKHIINRAKSLGKDSLIPEGWVK